ncbi:MAG: aldo/keto reductase [Bacteroidetes bacterium]|nr:aldo/keto reductase [Bacteroidota bacterium]
MKKRYWYGLQKETNPIGFGCWQIAGSHSIGGLPNGWGEVDTKEALHILITAINSGIDFFDTAQGYNSGKSEQLLGEAIKQTKKDVIVCTKIVLTDDEIKKQTLDLNFSNRVEESLKRLEKDRLDILLIHNPPDNIRWTEFDYTQIQELQKSGKIGTFGVSARGLNGAKNVVEAKFGTVLEWVFNVFERRPVSNLFPLIEQNKFNFIARSPLSRGLINPKYLTNTPIFNDDDFRSTLPADWVEWTLDSLKKIHANGVAADDIIRQSILYCIQNKAVTSTIIGIRTTRQLEDILKMNTLNIHSECLNNNFLDGVPECFPKWA